MYTDQLEWHQITCDLLKFAYTYKIQSLKNLCLKCLKTKISVENALELLSTASLIHNEEMMKYVTEFCLKNRGLIRKDFMWDELSANPELTCSILENAIFAK